MPGPGTGALNYHWVQLTAGAGGRENIIELNGKGSVYGGWMYFNSVATPALQNLILTVDGAVFPTYNLGNMRNWGFFSPEGYLFALTMFSVEDDLWCITIGETMSFGLTYLLEFVNGTAGNIISTTDIYYYNIS